MFAYELERRLQKRNSSIQSLAAHPGVSNTELSRYLPTFIRLIAPLVMPILAQSAQAGAQPILRAALDRTIRGGNFVGPNGKDQYKGKPVVVDSNINSKDEEKAKRLWSVSEKLSEIRYLN